MKLTPTTPITIIIIMRVRGRSDVLHVVLFINQNHFFCQLSEIFLSLASKAFKASFMQHPTPTDPRFFICENFFSPKNNFFLCSFLSFSHFLMFDLLLACRWLASEMKASRHIRK